MDDNLELTRGLWHKSKGWGRRYAGWLKGAALKRVGRLGVVVFMHAWVEVVAPVVLFVEPVKWGWLTFTVWRPFRVLEVPCVRGMAPVVDYTKSPTSSIVLEVSLTWGSSVGNVQRL